VLPGLPLSLYRPWYIIVAHTSAYVVAGLVMLSVALELAEHISPLPIIAGFLIAFYLLHRRVGYSRLRRALYTISEHGILPASGRLVPWSDMRTLELAGPHIVIWRYEATHATRLSSRVRHLSPAALLTVVREYHQRFTQPTAD
jgi:hypothetical protein